MPKLKVYIASSFKHKHAVQLLSRELIKFGYDILDWTEKARPPENLTPAERRIWFDTDHGGTIFSFCAEACKKADLIIYLGTSGQDAGVEVGIAYGAGVPILGICGPLEAKGLMLHGAANLWLEHIDDALKILEKLIKSSSNVNSKEYCKEFLDTFSIVN